MGADVLCELPEELPEQVCQQWTSQIQALVAVVIPVILVPSAQRNLQAHTQSRDYEATIAKHHAPLLHYTDMRTLGHYDTFVDSWKDSGP